MGRIWIWAVLLTAASLVFAPVFKTEALAEPRTALVIGNGSYLKTPLDNPINDAKDMAAVLMDCGFNVILETNRDKAAMLEAVARFGTQLERGGVGLFFYSGHGIQVNGINYIIPVGARAADVLDIKSQCLEISHVLAAMAAAKNALNIVILDACRNNPFETVPGVERGLALMNAPRGAYIAFSTRPGSLSGDGYTRNGLFTSKLLKHIRTPGLSLVDLFMTVRNQVLAASNDTQEPWDNHALRRHFYFVPDGGTTETVAAVDGEDTNADGTAVESTAKAASEQTLDGKDANQTSSSGTTAGQKSTTVVQTYPTTVYRTERKVVRRVIRKSPPPRTLKPRWPIPNIFLLGDEDPRRPPYQRYWWRP